MLLANAVLRIGGGAGTVLAGVYLADLGDRGLPRAAALAGALGAASFGAEVVAAVPMGLLADALSPRAVMTGGALLGGFAVFLFGTTTEPPLFFVSKALEGIGAAAVVPALLARVVSLTETRAVWRARAMSYFELSLLSGIALGGIAATQLWGRLGPDAFGAVAAAYLACAALLLAAGAAGDRGGGWRAAAGIQRAWRNPSLRRLAPIWLLVNAIIGMWLAPPLSLLLTRRTGGPQFLDGVLAGQPHLLGWVLFGYAGIFGVGVIAWSLVLPRLPVGRVLRITLGAMLAACVGLFALNHAGGANSEVRWAIGGGTALCVMVESGFTPAALLLLAGVVGSQTGRGVAMGIYSALLGLGAAAGSLMAGWLGDWLAVDGLIYGTAVLAVVALGLTTLLETRAAVPASGV